VASVNSYFPAGGATDNPTAHLLDPSS